MIQETVVGGANASPITISTAMLIIIDTKTAMASPVRFFINKYRGYAIARVAQNKTEKTVRSSIQFPISIQSSIQVSSRMVSRKKYAAIPAVWQMPTSICGIRNCIVS